SSTGRPDSQFLRQARLDGPADALYRLVFSQVCQEPLGHGCASDRFTAMKKRTKHLHLSRFVEIRLGERTRMSITLRKHDLLGGITPLAPKPLYYPYIGKGVRDR